MSVMGILSSAEEIMNCKLKEDRPSQNLCLGWLKTIVSLREDLITPT